MSKYMTKQRRILTDYFMSHVDEQLTAKRIANELTPCWISVSAIYRNLSDMESDGLIKRCSKNGSREVYYQYTAARKCAGCFHLTCRICGRVFHMNPSTAGLMLSRVADEDGFYIDMSDTVIFGVCSKCAEA